MNATHHSEVLPSGAPSSAVLLLIFNRPELTARVFGAIRDARPSRLYIAADGPRQHVASDEGNCCRARAVVAAVDWPCELKLRFRDSNLGCRRAVTDATDWFFENEAEGIVLEDDCLPRAEFFRFCTDLLCLYRDNPRILSISGSCFQGDRTKCQASFYFGKHFHCWGWATWRRAWPLMHPDLPSDSRRRRYGLQALADGAWWFPGYWQGIEELCALSLVDSWAYRVSLACFERWDQGAGPLHVVPRVNLVDNLGLGNEGTHASGSFPVARSESLTFPLTIPESIVRDTDRDRWTDRHVFGISATVVLRMRLSNQWQRLRRMLGVH